MVRTAVAPSIQSLPTSRIPPAKPQGCGVRKPVGALQRGEPSLGNNLPVGSAYQVVKKKSGLQSGATWPGATPPRGVDSVNRSLAGSPVPSTLTPTSANTIPALSPSKGSFLLPPLAPEFEGKYTVVFDLDETLVSNRMPGFRPAIRRPHLDHLLKSLKGKAELVLWTASIESVGKPVLRQIDPKGEYFHHAIYRSPSWFHEKPGSPHYKDLRQLGRDMERVIIVENNPFSVRLNKTNAIMVHDFEQPNPADTALKRISAFLRGLIESGKSVPEYIKTSGHTQPMRMVRLSAIPRSQAQGEPYYYIGEKVPEPKSENASP